MLSGTRSTGTQGTQPKAKAHHRLYRRSLDMTSRTGTDAPWRASSAIIQLTRLSSASQKLPAWTQSFLSMVHIGLVKTQNCFQKRRSLALAWPCVLPKEQGHSATHAHLDQRTVDVSHAPCGRLGSRKLGPHAAVCFSSTKCTREIRPLIISIK